MPKFFWKLTGKSGLYLKMVAHLFSFGVHTVAELFDIHDHSLLSSKMEFFDFFI